MSCLSFTFIDRKLKKGTTGDKFILLWRRNVLFFGTNGCYNLSSEG
jgi:hypothetical protein